MNNQILTFVSARCEVAGLKIVVDGSYPIWEFIAVQGCLLFEGLIGRLLPGIRTFISLPAGTADMSIGRFVVFTTIGSLPWVAILAYGGYSLGQN